MDSHYTVQIQPSASWIRVPVQPRAARALNPIDGDPRMVAVPAGAGVPCCDARWTIRVPQILKLPHRGRGWARQDRSVGESWNWQSTDSRPEDWQLLTAQGAIVGGSRSRHPAVLIAILDAVGDGLESGLGRDAAGGGCQTGGCNRATGHRGLHPRTPGDARE